jgi:asparagine synthase (glutamine-hydrolysing)
MCWIHAVFDIIPFTPSRETDIYAWFEKIQHRWPDSSHTIILQDRIFLWFHRLAMIDTTSQADQPFHYTTDMYEYYVICNGEIYNYQDLITRYDLHPRSGSDCEVIGLLTIQFDFETMITLIAWEFACCVIKIHKETQQYETYITRDHIWVRPLFLGFSKFWYAISSELKGLCNDYETVQQLEPGTWRTYISRTDTRTSHIYTDYTNTAVAASQELHIYQSHIRELFTTSVRERLQTDRPLACLLSGGLDSSLVSAIAAKYSTEKIHTFTIGMEGATDLPFGQQVAEHIGSHHHVVMLTHADGLQAIDETIYAIESYDITTVRASVRQFLIAKYIQTHTDFKAILCGELSDELCSGYKYFHNAPDEICMHRENVRLIKDIHRFDGLRTDRTMAYHGLEVRLPFADKAFLEYYLSIDPKIRMPQQGMEKRLLRSAFADEDLLPPAILRRSKEAFSDGVSWKQKSRFHIIQEYIETLISDEEFATESKKYIHSTPFTKESYYYRKKFAEYFWERHSGVIPYFWMPRRSWDVKDPSARILSVYE